jgi:hypothetical protein
VLILRRRSRTQCVIERRHRFVGTDARPCRRYPCLGSVGSSTGKCPEFGDSTRNVIVT